MTKDFFNGSGTSARIKVEDLIDATTVELVHELVDAGALVSLGRSRDGGALSVTVTSGGRFRREWCREAEEVADFLRQATAAVQALGPSPATVRSLR
jgi:hypothetical protein